MQILRCIEARHTFSFIGQLQIRCYIRIMETKAYLQKLVRQPDEKIDLAEAALHIAAEEYPDLDIPTYLQQLRGWGEEMKRSISSRSLLEKIEKINDWFYDRLHFSGNVDNYYDPKNSFLNEVIDRRKGIPITLSVIYLDFAWNLGLSAYGIGFPGHFLVGVPDADHPVFIDTFHNGKVMTASQCEDFLKDISEDDVTFQRTFLAPVTKQQTLIRMLRNLRGIYLEKKNYAKLVKVLGLLIVMNPDVPEEVRDRGIIYYEMEAFRLAFAGLRNIFVRCNRY